MCHVCAETRAFSRDGKLTQRKVCEAKFQRRHHFSPPLELNGSLHFCHAARSKTMRRQGCSAAPACACAACSPACFCSCRFSCMSSSDRACAMTQVEDDTLRSALEAAVGEVSALSPIGVCQALFESRILMED
eukprot:6180019-Pleurochrysis_carterae.AAC.1